MPFVRIIVGIVALANLALYPSPCLANSADRESPDSNAFPPVSLVAERIVSGDTVIEDLVLELETSGRFSFSSHRLGFPEPVAALDGFRISGLLRHLDVGAGGISLESLLDYSGLQASWMLKAPESGLESRLEFSRAPLENFAVLPIMPEAFDWMKGGFGRAAFRLAQSGEGGWNLDYDLAIDQLSFDSPDGRFVGEGVGLSLSGAARYEQSGILADVRGSLDQGELLLGNLYLDLNASPLEWHASPAWNAEQKKTSGNIHLSDPGAVALEASFDLSDWSNPAAWDVRFRRLRLAFPDAYRQYLESIAATWTLDGLELTGALEWSGAWQSGELYSGDLVVTDLSVVDTAQGRFALTGLNTRLQPGQYDAESKLSWQGLLLGRVNLGPGAALLDSEPGRFALLEPLELGVLGGSLRLNALSYTLPYARQEGRDHAFLSASLRELEMKPLTQALGWPEFGGTISGELPGASLSNGVFSLQGGIRLGVFDGEVEISDMQIERPFGVLPSLSANVEMHGLDLERLTETFSFGHIGGRVDGYVEGLRVLDWEPVAFDAWLGTPERTGKAGKISRRAVNNLASIGGGGAAAALANPLLKVFSQFSYKRLGLGCKLENYVCEVSGVADSGEGVLLMEGAGLPKITIRAYNRRVDWPQMVANLTAIADGGSI